MKWQTLSEKAHFLAGLPLFKDLSAQARHELADTLEQRVVEAGETICRHGEVSECLYIVISGRFRVFLDDQYGEKAVNEVGRCEIIGEIGLLTGEARSATVMAVRDSSVLVLSKALFDELTQKHAGIALALVRIQIDRLHRIQRRSLDLPRSEAIAVVPAAGAIITDFTARFCRALSKLGEVVHFRNPQKSGDGWSAEESGEDWLQSAAERSRFLIYESDESATAWTAGCIRQADRILVVADAAVPPALSGVESQFQTLRSAHALPRRDLVIVHDGESRPVASTWLALRHIDMHHHLKMNTDADYDRLARLVAGRAIGLVLGGGGARAFAQIGVIQALADAGVPIDAIGGTSMGALIGAFLALDLSPERMAQICRYMFRRGAVWDFTIPFVSLISAKRIGASLSEIFSDIAIEDLHRSYFCISSNLSTGNVAVHRSGSLLKWLKASISIPGIAPPIIEQGQLFYDGGILNNLPVDVMNLLGVTQTIAVNSSSLFDQRLVDVKAENCSPWRILFNRANPFSGSISYPSIFNVLYRSATLNCLRSTIAAQENASLLIAPKVSHYGLFEWNAIDEIIEAGRLEAQYQLANSPFNLSTQKPE